MLMYGETIAEELWALLSSEKMIFRYLKCIEEAGGCRRRGKRRSVENSQRHWTLLTKSARDIVRRKKLFFQLEKII